MTNIFVTEFAEFSENSVKTFKKNSIVYILPLTACFCVFVFPIIRRSWQRRIHHHPSNHPKTRPSTQRHLFTITTTAMKPVVTRRVAVLLFSPVVPPLRWKFERYFKRQNQTAREVRTYRHIIVILVLLVKTRSFSNWRHPADNRGEQRGRLHVNYKLD